jgi:hypothetical protein
MPSYNFIAPPDVHTDYTQQPSHCRAQHIQRLMLAAYSPTSQARYSNEVWPEISMELQTKPLPAQNALLAMNHRPQEVKALCSNAAISHPPGIHLSCKHHPPAAVQAVQLPAVTQLHSSLPLTDVSINRQQLLQPRNFPASVTSHDSMHPKQTVTTTNELIPTQPERPIEAYQTDIGNQRSVGSIDPTGAAALDLRLSHTQSAVKTDCKQNNTAYPVNSSQQTLIIDTEPQSQSQPRQSDPGR